MDYNFKEIESKWQAFWAANQTFKAEVDSTRPKYYVLDMFPYPSGAGLHVGHPLGYIASDIYSRYKRLRGFNVLHPMGYDAFGLPAEQYAIQTGQHPAVTTEKNIARYREQMDILNITSGHSGHSSRCSTAGMIMFSRRRVRYRNLRLHLLKAALLLSTLHAVR